MKVRVWDLPLRVFHWLLVLSFAAAFIGSRSERLILWHTVAGYSALFLVLFRIAWGFSGNRYARFSGFITGMGPVMGYVRRVLACDPPRYVGHNPAVGWVILFMLASVLVITTTGVVAYGGEEGMGVLAGHVRFKTGVAAHEVHELMAYVLLAVVIVHISAALVHDFVFRENIILSMITGEKEDAEGWAERTGAPDLKERSAVRLFALLGLTLAVVVAVLYMPLSFLKAPSGVYAPARITDERGVEVELPVPGLWMDECGSACHSALHPTLLPAASWVMIMDGLDEHFGDDASLDAADTEEIRRYLVSSSAERSGSEASQKILLSLKEGVLYTRITETPYWKKKHKKIKDEVYQRRSVTSRSNCLACHPGAEVGSFEDMDITVPEN